MRLTTHTAKLLSALRRNSEWLHILASLVTILSLFVALYLFRAQLQIQSEDRRNDHYAQLSALRVELGEITWTMNRYMGLTTNDLTKIFHHFFPTENLREATRTGWIAGGALGPEVIRVYQLVNRENLHMSLENSPDYLQTDPASWLDRKSNAMKDRIRKLPELKAQVVNLDQHLALLQQTITTT